VHTNIKKTKTQGVLFTEVSEGECQFEVNFNSSLA